MTLNTDKTPRQFLADYLAEGKVMQLATVSNGQPWICTVYYVIDEQLNFYWLSLPTRRHSQEISNDSRAAITVAVKHDLPVIGIQAEGEVEVVVDQESVKKIADLYAEKYGSAKTYYDRFVNNIHEHYMYRLVPKNLVLFDEVNYKENPSIKII